MLIKHKILFVIFYFIVFSSSFSYIAPVYESPDENAHLEFINYVTKYQELPDQYEGMTNKEKSVGQGHQHPFYYILTGFLNYALNDGSIIHINSRFNKLHEWNGGNTFSVPYFYNDRNDVFNTAADKHMFYFFRILSVLFGALNIFLVYKITKLITNNELFSLLTAFLMASIPQFAFITGMINNDNLANLMSTVCLYMIVKVFKHNGYSIKLAVTLGIVLGIAVLTKKTLMFLPPGVVMMLFYKSVFIEKEFKNSLRYLAVILSITLLISIWYFVRNSIVYNDVFGTQMEIVTMPELVNKKSLFSYYFISRFLSGLLNSFIGSFGWMYIRIPLYIHLFYLVLGFAAVFGFIRSKIIQNRYLFNIAILMTLFVLLCLIGITFFNLTYTQHQGRYMFPVISFIVIILSLGLKYFTGLYKNYISRRILIISVITALVIFDFICLFTVYSFYNRPSIYL